MEESLIMPPRHFAHGQQDDDTASLTAFGKLTQPVSTPRLTFTSLSPPILPATNSFGQQQEQIIGSDLVAPSPSPSQVSAYL